MGNDKESPRLLLPRESEEIDSDPNFRFAMGVNGHRLLEHGVWNFDADTVRPISMKSGAQRVSFFGPNSSGSFFLPRRTGPEKFISAFGQRAVVDVIGKYRKTDEEQATRLAFLFGGIVRHWGGSRAETDIKDAVGFVVRMTMLGNERSADAIANAMAMYVISGGSIEEDNHFAGSVYRMAEAVAEDPILPKQTEDLGISQIARIRRFLDKIQDTAKRPFPQLKEEKAALKEFPTVGAEFHFPPDVIKDFPNFWKRLAILNMSQYQQSSFVQFSRNDRDVIEVRMNPSFYPITIANWNHIRLLLPEINQAFFTITFNRNGRPSKGEGDFHWEDDDTLLKNMRALGMLTYAGTFENVPRSAGRGEINFGEIYLGQTVRLNRGRYEFSGNWDGGEGVYGQLGIYAGFGDNFPLLAYYISMALADPSIMESMGNYGIKTLEDALAVSSSYRREAFILLQNRIEKDERLNRAFEAGHRIAELLSV